MSAPATLWNGRPLDQGPLALIIVPHAAHADAGREQPLFGAAANEVSTVILTREHFARFLKTHADATLVCFDAAGLHWGLHQLLVDGPPDPEALAALWGFSRDARLVDLRFLDFHCRRLAEPLAAVAASFHEIAARVLGAELPADDELQRRILEAPATPAPSGADAGHQLAGLFARTMLDGYRALSEIACAALLPVIAELRRLGRLRGGQRLDDAALCAEHVACFGPLGVAGDVQWAIAVRPALRSGLRVDVERWNEFRRWSEDRYATASRQLLEDAHARKAFRHDGPVVDLLDSGQPRTDSRKLGAWLRAVSGELCDRNNCPVMWEARPPGNPERWGVWASCHRLLHAWRTLTRAGRACRADVTAGKVYPSYDRCPLVPSTAPDLAWLRSSGHRACVPGAGHRFLVCRLQNLPVRCLAAVCRARWYTGDGRLAGYLLASRRRDREPYKSWLQAAAGELYAAAGGLMTGGEHAGSEAAGPEAGSEGRRGRAAKRLARLKKARPDEYRLWLRLTRGLLMTLPLGLRPEHLAVLLKLDHNLDVSGGAVGRLGRLLAEHVAYELKGFLADDTLEVLTERVGVPFGQALRKLAPGEHVETVNAYVRNELIRGHRPSPLWDMLTEVGIPDDPQLEQERGPQLLRQRGLSLGGRMTDATFCAQVRQQEYLFAVDDVIKRVAYALSAGYRLVAVAGPELVLEVRGRGSDPDVARHVALLARRAQRPLLGRLAAPCTCRWHDDW